VKLAERPKGEREGGRAGGPLNRQLNEIGFEVSNKQKTAACALDKKLSAIKAKEAQVDSLKKKGREIALWGRMGLSFLVERATSSGRV